MGSYSVRLKRSAEKDLRRIDKSRVPSIVATIERLEQDPRPAGCRKLVGSDTSYRIRVGDYRRHNGVSPRNHKFLLRLSL